MESIFLLIFGVGFYLFVIHLIVNDHRERYERRLNEAREFGFGGANQHTTKTLDDQ